MTDKHIDGFEDRLQKAIGAMDMTYSEVCRKTGIGQSCMNGYINYGMMPNCLNLVKLAKLLGVTTDWLLGLEGERDMTREDARHYLQSSGFSEEQIDTIEQAFKQEPSSDLIRRTDLLDMVEDMTDQFGIKHRVITEGMISLLPSVNSQSCEDAISRKALKHKLQEHHDFFVNAYGGFSNLPQNDKSRVDEILNCIAMVVNEPSVKPQDCDTCEVGNPCLYCKHEFKAQADGEYITQSAGNEIRQKNYDLISRQAALKELKESAEHHANDSREEALLRRDRDIIRALPSVKQEPCEDAISRKQEPYKGMTNGKVMDKLFPEISEHLYDDVFTEDWWNSPFELQESEVNNG